MRAVVFGTYDGDRHPRVRVLAEGLRHHGVELVECNVPLRVSTAARVAALRQPWRVPLFALRLLGCWIRLAVAARRLPRPDVVLVGYMGHFDVHLARWLFRRSVIVLDHLISAGDTARDRGERGGLKLALLQALDRAALRAADVVVVDTEEHRALLPETARDRTVVVPVGAPEAWFAAAAGAGTARAAGNGPGGTPGSQRPLRVIFFGLYTPLQGAPVIGAALGLLGGEALEVTMVGTGQDREATQAAAGDDPRVRWLDWVPADELPALVAGHDVCLGIVGTGPKAMRVVPNKVYQGAAAGCAVVTSDTPPQRAVLGDAAVLVPPGDPERLAGALRALAADPAYTAKLRAAAADLARQRFAGAQVAAELARRLAALTVQSDPPAEPAGLSQPE
jgi:glycosyltransferase involved in cell wall biosynthesis